MRALSLYIHVPFCTRRCSYCSFYHVPRNPELETDFVDALAGEFEHAIAALGDVRLRTVFIGGGTPSALGVRRLGRVFDAFGPFVSRDGAREVTCEVNPEDVDDELLAFLRKRGVNRLSVGTQSMDGAAQRVLKRCSPDINRRAIDRVMAFGFDNVNFDVLLGIPGATVETTRATIETLAAYEPSHFSVYCLEPGGDMGREVASFFNDVDPERSADEYLLTCEILRQRGYRHYEVSNFARAGFESVHNRVYWGGGDYLGVGPGAHSFIDGRRFHNAPSLSAYLKDRGPDWMSGRVHDPVEKEGEELERAMLALRTAEGMPLSWVECAAETIAELEDAGLAQAQDERLTLTDRGFLLMNEVLLKVKDRTRAC